MNERQKIAIQHPVMKIEKPRRLFTDTLYIDEYSLATTLVVEKFDNELPRWHASISCLKTNYMPQYLSTVPPFGQRILRQELLNLLAGVGVENKTENLSEDTLLHAVRPLTETECKMLNLS